MKQIDEVTMANSRPTTSTLRTTSTSNPIISEPSFNLGQESGYASQGKKLINGGPVYFQDDVQSDGDKDVVLPAVAGTSPEYGWGTDDYETEDAMELAVTERYVNG